MRCVCFSSLYSFPQVHSASPLRKSTSQIHSASPLHSNYLRWSKFQGATGCGSPFGSRMVKNNTACLHCKEKRRTCEIFTKETRSYTGLNVNRVSCESPSRVVWVKENKRKEKWKRDSCQRKLVPPNICFPLTKFSASALLQREGMNFPSSTRKMFICSKLCAKTRNVLIGHYRDF